MQVSHCKTRSGLLVLRVLAQGCSLQQGLLVDKKNHRHAKEFHVFLGGVVCPKNGTKVVLSRR